LLHRFADISPQSVILGLGRLPRERCEMAVSGFRPTWRRDHEGSVFSKILEYDDSGIRILGSEMASERDWVRNVSKPWTVNENEFECSVYRAGSDRRSFPAKG
jgi:hypothetical protein